MKDTIITHDNLGIHLAQMKKNKHLPMATETAAELFQQMGEMVRVHIDHELRMLDHGSIPESVKLDFSRHLTQLEEFFVNTTFNMLKTKQSKSLGAYISTIEDLLNDHIRHPAHALIKVQ